MNWAISAEVTAEVLLQAFFLWAICTAVNEGQKLNGLYMIGIILCETLFFLSGAMDKILKPLLHLSQYFS